MGDPLLVIIPSRGRPLQVADLAQCWRKTSCGVARLLVCLDDDDPTIQLYPPRSRYPFVDYDIAPRSGFAPRLSAVAVREARTGRWGAVASWTDKHRPRTPGWDAILAWALHLRRPGVVFGDDGMNGSWLPTACCVSAEIVDTLGYLCPPELAHLYVDTFWRDLGWSAGRLLYVPAVLIEHLHPAAGKGQWDDLMRAANTPEQFAREEARYLGYLAERFEADVAAVRALA